MTEPLRSTFDEELEAIKSGILIMSKMVVETIPKGTEALLEELNNRPKSLKQMMNLMHCPYRSKIGAIKFLHYNNLLQEIYAQSWVLCG